MLATLVAEPFHKPGWVYEEKYDGYRILAYKEGSHVTLLSRNHIDRTATFAEVAAAVAKLPQKTLLLDGEAVAFDKKRVSRFQLLQSGTVQHAYAVFDCLYMDGRDLRREPLSKRRPVVEGVIPPGSVLMASRRLADNGLEAYKTAMQKNYEGVVAKDLAAPYIEGRSTKWLKVKVHQQDEFVIVGYTAPQGARSHFGALLLGAYENGGLVYVGKVGTGFGHRTLADLYRKMRPLASKQVPVVNVVRERGATWVKPRLVAQISFQEWTEDRKLRQPVFLGLRDDKAAEDVRMPGTGRAGRAQ